MSRFSRVWVTALFVSLLITTAPTRAAHVTYNQSIPTVQDVPTIADHLTFGNEMAGMEVSVQFSGGTTETQTWLDAGVPLGHATGSDGDWSLSEFGDTYGGQWTLTYHDLLGKGTLTGFAIDGFAKYDLTGDPKDGVAFDRTFGGAFGTANSFRGIDFDDMNHVMPPFGVDVTYSDAVNALDDVVMGPQGDLFRRLGVKFVGGKEVTSKWTQRPEDRRGENVPASVDWRAVMQTIDERAAVADDFVSDGRPITKVRWWGSYFDDQFQPRRDPVTGLFVPRVEDGFLLAFHSDAGKPQDLLGAYIAPGDKVTILPTNLVGWDQHRIWMYEVDLADTHLDHPSELSTPEAFREREGETYWLSITAEDGHVLDENWEAIDTGDPQLDLDFWGWHTSPEEKLNNAVTGGLEMPGEEWLYLDWREFDPAHGLSNMAFQLLTPDPLAGAAGLDGVNRTQMTFVQDTDTPTVPEPTSWLLLASGVLGLLVRRSRTLST